MVCKAIKISVFFVVSFFSKLGFCQDNFKLYYQETSNGYQIMADNDEYSPVSAKIDFQLENLTSTQGNNKIFVIPPQTKKHVITDLNVIDRKKQIKLGYKSVYNYGNHHQKKYDTHYEYYLPYEKGTEYWLSQGYNGTISHQNENALDFEMPIGTKITAVREGVVVDIEESYSKRCTTSECAKFNNYILIYHSDGTFSEYTHIKKNGAKVAIGDQVKKGQFIGYSGDVGWATGPHLHFIVFFQRLKKRETLSTKFLIGNGKKASVLKEKVKYSRSY